MYWPKGGGGGGADPLPLLNPPLPYHISYLISYHITIIYHIIYDISCYIISCYNIWICMARNQSHDVIAHACIHASISEWNTMDLNSNIFLKPLCYTLAEYMTKCMPLYHTFQMPAFLWCTPNFCIVIKSCSI